MPAAAGATPRPRADGRRAWAPIVTFTVDRLAVLAEPAGGLRRRRLRRRRPPPVELTDVDGRRARCAIGGRVELTFRRLFTADGIHNYFWKGTAGPGREA